MLSIATILPVSNIPVRILNIEFVITDQRMEKDLIGRPFLKAIGLYFQQHLESFRDIVLDRVMSDLAPETAKICADGVSIRQR